MFGSGKVIKTGMLTMDQIEEIRRLEADGRPRAEIARRVGVSRPTVRKYLVVCLVNR